MTKILVTGGCGFIGRHVTEELLNAGYSVRILDAMIDQVHGDAEAGVPEAAEVIRADVRDAAAVRQALDGVEGVIHLAAEVGVGQSMYEIARYVGGNDLGTAVLLESMIGLPIRRIVVASSMSVYGEGPLRGLHRRSLRLRAAQGRRARQGRRLGSTRPGRPAGGAHCHRRGKAGRSRSIYALTKYTQGKAGADLRRGLWRRGGRAPALQCLWRRSGALQPYTGVLANFASRLANGQPPMIFEDGRQRRDFVHVRDVARAFRLALRAAAGAGPCHHCRQRPGLYDRRSGDAACEAMGVPPKLLRTS